MVILDDIHWSKEMNQAWKTIKARPEISISIDLFEAGVLFFKRDIPKTDLIMKY